eukprot:GFUD01005089.1.p1 GENE.GFUD01005089.1~~GFUD01005089.1.p1  ORF type:complete len:405 (-),score=135.84 GFUD01005089.1:170-1384(-)
MRTSLIIVSAMSLSLTGANNPATKMMKENIEDISRFLKLELVPDVKINNGHIEDNFNLTIKTANNILDYVEKSMTETADKVQKTFETMASNITQNLEEIMQKSSSNLNALQKLTIDNEVAIANDFTTKLNNVVAKIETRMKQHEDFITTSVAVCAEAFSHMSRGTVKYSSLFMESVLINGAPPVSEVLDPKSGDFVVPPGGDGIYHISYGVLIDTMSPRTGMSQARMPPRFAVKSSQGKRITIHEASQIWATVGVKNQYKDLVPASRAITLNLRAGDIISLEQINNHAEQAYRLTFCVHLVHPTLVSSVTWEKLPEPKALVLNMTTTYVEPILQDFQVGDLKSTEKKPEVLPPVMSPLQSPTSQFVVGRSAKVPGHDSSDPLNPLYMIGGVPEQPEAGSENGYE